MSAWFAGFDVLDVPVGDGITLRARVGGNATKPPLLLLHGYPQTHAMWRRVAERLAPDFRLVLPDLRGYGDSTRPPAAPPPAPPHAAMSKRAMAADMVALMRHLGHERFLLAGHDRGGRVAYRLAYDHPQRVERLAVLDIVPTLELYEPTTRALATAYYHWFFFIQPAPLPERLIHAEAKFFLHWSLGGWGSRGLQAYEPEALAEYERCFCDPETIHATCEDYRAGATLDCEHDAASRAAGERIACPFLVLWGARGVVGRLYDPPAVWRPHCALEPEGAALDAGHFIPEEQPEETARRLAAFFGGPRP